MHPLLLRQLSRLGLSSDAAPTLDAWRSLLARVVTTYQAADEDRALLQRSLALSSAEMSALYENLRTSSEATVLRKNRELELSLGRARAVMEAVADGILVVGADGRVVAANRRFAEMWMLPNELLTEGDDAKLVAYVAEQLTDGEQFLARIEYLYEHVTENALDEIRLKDTRVFERYSGPVCLRDGELFGRIWCFRDVTEERKLASERLVVSERLASLGRLTASVAHELNNPLAYVCANLDLLGEGLEAQHLMTQEAVALLDDVQEGLGRITTIVRDLRGSSRFAEEELEVFGVEQPLNTAIQMATNEIRHRARLVRDIPLGLQVRANSTRLGQVFLNLLVNAAHAIGEGHAQENTIAVRVASEGNKVCISITDTGDGIRPEDVERIFDPFFTTKPIGVGTGLGLSICRNTIEAYGGTISVFSELKRGATFTVRLPIAPEAAPPSRSMSDSHRVLGRQCRVLVIDDEPAILRAVQRILRGRHEVVTCQRAREALTRFEAGEVFDLILCDVMMPDMTGVQFYEQVDSAFPELRGRLVFMTGGTLSVRAEAFMSQVGRVLEKPLRATDIRGLVASLVTPVRPDPV